jgi:hypothetical protein
MNARQFRVWLAALLAAASGCSPGDRPPLGAVRGRVTLDGKPLPRAVVSFRPLEGGRVSRGMTDQDGRYELFYLRDIRGAIVGAHKVMIVTADEDASEELPPRYHRETTLSAEVVPGDNEHDFKLTLPEVPP